jgi:hypothetical protein
MASSVSSVMAAQTNEGHTGSDTTGPIARSLILMTLLPLVLFIIADVELGCHPSIITTRNGRHQH